MEPLLLVSLAMSLAIHLLRLVARRSPAVHRMLYAVHEWELMAYVRINGHTALVFVHIVTLVATLAYLWAVHIAAMR